MLSSDTSHFQLLHDSSSFPSSEGNNFGMFLFTCRKNKAPLCVSLIWKFEVLVPHISLAVRWSGHRAILFWRFIGRINSTSPMVAMCLSIALLSSIDLLCFPGILMMPHEQHGDVLCLRTGYPWHQLGGILSFEKSVVVNSRMVKWFTYKGSLRCLNWFFDFSIRLISPLLV